MGTILSIYCLSIVYVMSICCLHLHLVAVCSTRTIVTRRSFFFCGVVLSTPSPNLLRYCTKRVACIFFVRTYTVCVGEHCEMELQLFRDWRAPQFPFDEFRKQRGFNDESSSSLEWGVRQELRSFVAGLDPEMEAMIFWHISADMA